MPLNSLQKISIRSRLLSDSRVDCRLFLPNLDSQFKAPFDGPRCWSGSTADRPVYPREPPHFSGAPLSG